MPKQGQKSVTLNETIYQKAEQKAKKEHKSVARFVADLIEEKTMGA
jgi:predicted DNA-binding ribbon-helix-helix protein